MGSSPQCGKEFDIPVQTLLRCPYSFRVRAILHSSASVRTLIIPNTDSHNIVRTYENTARADRNGYSAALPAAVPYLGKATRISCKGQRSTKTMVSPMVWMNERCF